MRNLSVNVELDQNSVGSTSKLLFAVNDVGRRTFIIIVESLNILATEPDKIWIRQLSP
jgi:hypothetical protein